MTDKVLKWLDEKIANAKPYKEFKKDLFIVIMSLFSISIIISMVYMVSSINPNRLTAEQLREFNNVKLKFQMRGPYSRLSYFGSVVSPAIQILAFMIIARELWRYRKKRWRENQSKQGSIFSKFSYYLSKIEDFLNELLIAFLGFGTFILIFSASIILTGPVDDVFLRGLIQGKYIAQIIYNWTIMLALIIISRESYIIKNSLLKER